LAVELFGWLKYFRQQRLQVNFTQAELLKKELIMLGSAILAIAVLSGLVFLLVRIHEKQLAGPDAAPISKTSDRLRGPRVC
jgi:hypothetical protein